MKIRKHFCQLLGHRYRAIWFKNPYPGLIEGQAGVPDTEFGCVYCGHTEPNAFYIQAKNIDWKATKHRTQPPLHRVIGKYKYKKGGD